jgi:hypothetical protein
MNLLIRTEKPVEIEKELDEAVKEVKRGFKPSRTLKFLMKLSKVNVDNINEITFAEYKKLTKDTFSFTLTYPFEQHTKKMFMDKLQKGLKKIDDKIDIKEYEPEDIEKYKDIKKSKLFK